MCSHRRASEDCAYGMDDCGREGLVRLPGEEDIGIDEVIVPLRRFPKFGSSRGGVLKGERRL